MRRDPGHRPEQKEPPVTSRASRRDTVLVCGPWPSRRYSVFTVAQALLAGLHDLGRPVVYLCDAYGVRDRLGPEAVCVVDVPADRPFDWRAAFARKFVYRDLGAFLAADRAGSPGLLRHVGVVHTFKDSLILGSSHAANSTHFERTLADHVRSLTGRPPRLVRTREDDVQGNLDGFMRLTGIDYAALDGPGREALLRGDADLRPFVQAHVERNRDLMHSWGWGDALLDEAIHHAWWRVHQLRRWRHEITYFDAVVCLTDRDASANRELLCLPDARNLAVIHNSSPFEPADQRRVDRLLYDYHHRAVLSCYRGAGGDRQRIPFRAAHKKVLFVGRAARAKGSYEFAESLRELYHAGRRDVVGIFVGEFWPGARAELAALDRSGRAAEYLFFTGSVRDVDELAALFAFGDVTAVSSHYDAFPLVGLESYRMGTPCVVTEGTGAGEAYLDNPRRHGVEMARPVRRRHQGGIARYYGVDVGSLTEQIAFFIDNPRAAWGMGEDGRRFVRENYSTERMAAKYEELYAQILDAESRG
jgi:glycosyltransferase involved in cell wall biosynthesis